MNRLAARLYSFGVGLIGIGLLVILSDGTPARRALPLLLFAGLSLLIKRLGFHVFDEAAARTPTPAPRAQPAEVTHSLVGVIDLAALLVYGPIVGGWVAVLSEFTYLMLRRPRWAWRVTQRWETGVFNGGLKALMALTGGMVYVALGGLYATLDLTAGLVLPLTALFLTWFSLDHLGWAVRVMLSSGRDGLVQFLRRIVVPSLLVELAPLPVSLLIATVYTGLSHTMFLVLVMALVVASLVVQRLVETRRRLRAHVAELSLIADLGHEIQEAQMDALALCDLAYRYAGRVVDVSNFRLELLDRDNNRVQRAVWVENGRRREPTSVPMTDAMTWMQAHQRSVLIRDLRREAPPFSCIADGKTRSGMYVPLLASGELVGLLAVHSQRPRAFSEDDLRMLMAVVNPLAVAIENARLYQQVLEQERLQQELEVAREIQASLLPEAPPRIAGWDIAAWWQPARRVAGDFYDFIPLPDARWGILIADVSDKGVPAALFMALARTLIRTMVIDKRTPARALERANDLILADARADMFVTAFLAVLDPVNGQATYTNAGHLPPLIYRSQACSIASLRAGGIALGAVPSIELEQHTLALAPGDLLVMYTDGITEALNDRGEEFGEERLARLVAEHQAVPAEAVVRAIDAALADFVGDQPTFDDQALVVVKRMVGSLRPDG